MGERTILVVDDDEDYLCLLEAALQEARVTNPAEIVHDGEAALRYLASRANANAPTELPGLILLDLKMPGLNGLQVLEWIRARPELAGVPVILFTGNESAWARSQALTLGAVSVRIKPLSYQELVQQMAGIRDHYLQVPEIRQAA